MKALVYTKPLEVTYRDEADPQAAAGEVVLKIDAVGICGSDMHAYHGHDPRRNPPLILGHELAGTVVAGPFLGKRFTANPLITCGTCEFCVQGRNNLCANRTMVGMTRPGAFAERMSIPVGSLVEIPTGMDARTAALTEPAATALHALNLSMRAMQRPLPESRLLVIGGGAIGMLTALLARHYGCRDVRVAETNALRRGSVAKHAGVAVLEDRYLRRLPASTRVLFCSDGLRDQFAELFGMPANTGVLYNPALLRRPAADATLPDRTRRSDLTASHDGPVVGFLGGGDPRKGGDLVIDSVAAEPDLFLLHAGPSALDDARICGRSRGLGHLRDVTELLDVIDVLLVPSRFEPFGLVVVEAAARGVPVLVGPQVGAAPLVLAEDAGEVWLPGTPLGPEVRKLIARREAIAANGARVLERVDPARLADQLFADLTAAAESNRATR